MLRAVIKRNQTQSNKNPNENSVEIKINGKKLNVTTTLTDLTKDQLIILRMNDSSNQEDTSWEDLKTSLSKAFPGNQVIICAPEWNIEFLDTTQMAEMGWARCRPTSDVMALREGLTTLAEGK